MSRALSNGQDFFFINPMIVKLVIIVILKCKTTTNQLAISQRNQQTLKDSFRIPEQKCNCFHTC